MGFRLSWAALLSALLLLGAGCSDDAECSGDSDCPGDKICSGNNTCITPEGSEGEGEGEQGCHEHWDCDAPLVCDKITGRCVEREDPDLGVQEDSGTDTGPEVEDTGPEVEDTGPEGEDIADHDPPEVVRTVPAASTRDVAVDSTVQVVFSESLKEAIVEAPAILLYSSLAPQGSEVAARVEWDDETKTATLTPTEPLSPYSTYKLVVREDIVDLHGNHLANFDDIFFSTAPDAEAESFYGALARQYAPHVYQETNRDMVWADWLAPYDFDGAWRSDRKYEQWQARKEQLQGALYWNVTETKTHYFITYAHYHPFDYDQSGVDNRLRENSMGGAQVIVAKGGDHAGWLAVETYVGGGQIWSFTVEGKGIQARPGAEGGIGDFKSVMPAAWLIDDERYQAFVPFGTHEACIWGYEPRVMDLQCPQPNGGEFYHDSGLHYLPPGEGEEGEIPMAEVEACEEGGCPSPGEACIAGECSGFRYGLHSLAGEIWTRRIEFLEGGEDIWSSTFEYLPEPEADRRPGAGISLPNSFGGTPDTSPGQPPWAWDDMDDSEVARGQWFIDPAYSIHRHLAPAEGDDWSTHRRDYCWNVYLGIFERDAAGCSGHAAE